jgi:hypothetical protein
MTDFRMRSAQLIAAMDSYPLRPPAHRQLCNEVRAELKAPPPTDDELLELMPETMRDEFAYAATVCSDATGGRVKAGIFRVCLNTAALEYARAVLERWGGAA